MVTTVFPHVPPPELVHVLVVTEERTSISTDMIVTCLTSALVLEGLEDVGGLDGRILKRSPLCISPAVL